MTIDEIIRKLTVKRQIQFIEKGKRVDYDRLLLKEALLRKFSQEACRNYNYIFSDDSVVPDGILDNAIVTLFLCDELLNALQDNTFNVDHYLGQAYDAK
ncbi:hypothetical protein [Fangia hongkongensis]|uniref:hypothetical protein n=1 Tax=Fangia hongkongensis TaxID=270495 RepID=UPI00036BF271|nr:hypothetical protein [Fangia hongkongensis]MBK2124825.1 hypothetical protein [Fangia hongkongensis]